jgi:hypothetical protein
MKKENIDPEHRDLQGDLFLSHKSQKCEQPVQSPFFGISIECGNQIWYRECDRMEVIYEESIRYHEGSYIIPDKIEGARRIRIRSA